jgi:hypothetical protein
LYCFHALKVKPVSDGCAEGFKLLEVVVSFVASLREELWSVYVGLFVGVVAVVCSIVSVAAVVSTRRAVEECIVAIAAARSLFKWLMWFCSVFAGRSISLVVRPFALSVFVFFTALALVLVYWVIFQGLHSGASRCEGCRGCGFGLAGVGRGCGVGLGGVFGGAARGVGGMFGGRRCEFGKCSSFFGCYAGWSCGGGCRCRRCHGAGCCGRTFSPGSGIIRCFVVAALAASWSLRARSAVSIAPAASTAVAAATALAWM